MSRAFGARPEKGDRLTDQWVNGEIVVRRDDPRADQKADPVIGAFLDFLERDMIAHPQRLRPVTADDLARLEDLTAGVEVDLDEALPPDEE